MVIVGVYVAVHRQMTPTADRQYNLMHCHLSTLYRSLAFPSATVIVQTATPEPTVEATTNQRPRKLQPPTPRRALALCLPVHRSGELKSGKSVILLTSGGKVEAMKSGERKTESGIAGTES
jgi:hypothetical protein